MLTDEITHKALKITMQAGSTSDPCFLLQKDSIFLQFHLMSNYLLHRVNNSDSLVTDMADG